MVNQFKTSLNDLLERSYPVENLEEEIAKKIKESLILFFSNLGDRCHEVVTEEKYPASITEHICKDWPYEKNMHSMLVHMIEQMEQNWTDSKNQNSRFGKVPEASKECLKLMVLQDIKLCVADSFIR
jgi:hypothetical protein